MCGSNHLISQAGWNSCLSVLPDTGRQSPGHGVRATPRPRPAPFRVARRAQRALSGRVT